MKTDICLVLLIVIVTITGIYFDNKTVISEWECTTDTECTEECLKKCTTPEACRNCWDVFIDAELFDYYETKLDYLYGDK